MKKTVCLTFLISFVFLFSNGGSAQNKTVGLPSLLKEMVSRESLAKYPDPYYTTRQYSSYDRDSKKPGNQDWFANWDRTQFLRVEKNQGRKEYVMMDTDGPGAIVRFWMTFAGKNAGQGTLRIYFDGESEPTIEGTAFEVLSGGKLVGMPLSMSVSPKTNYDIRGHNLYLPLPFAGNCKITYQSDQIKSTGAKSGGESVYYNINYREYEEDTDVKTFAKQQLEENEKLLRRVQEQLLFRDKEYQMSKLETSTEAFDNTIAPGESHTVKVLGPAAIRRLSMDLDAQNPEQALRSTIMKISFDGREKVWVPVGDFFGTGYQYRESNTWYTTVTEEGKMSAYWVMPFQESAEITFKNLGEQEVTVQNGRVAFTDWDWNENSMYFGASWHQYSDLYTGERKGMDGSGNPFDVNYTELEGEGVYVGDVLTLFNTTYAWWGEGDEKIYIDGEDFPSHFGTGTEDYYGYAWVRPEVFTNHPFIAQPDGSGNITPGYTVNMRFRSLDDIPFQQSIKVDMEMWHWVSANIDFAPTTFYYLKPGGKTLTKPDVENAQRKVATKRSDLVSPKITDNRIEAEKFIIDEFTDGIITFQYLEEPKVSNNKQLWWRRVTPGNKLTAKFISEEEKTVRAEANFVVAPDYGKVKVSINGHTVLDEFNGFNDSVSIQNVDLGEISLQEGENQITFEMLDKHPDKEKGMIGLDYIDFKAVQ